MLAFLSGGMLQSKADEIILKNGKIIEGTARRNGSRVVVRPWNSDASVVIDENLIEAIIPKGIPGEPMDSASSTPPSTDHLITIPPNPAGSMGEGAEPNAVANIRSPSADFEPSIGMPEIEYLYSPAPDPQVRAAIETVFPRIVKICVDHLGMKFNGYVPLNIQIFMDTEEFEAYQQEHSNLHYDVEGYYAVNEDKIVVRGDRFRQNLVSTLYHEGTHALLRREFITIPSWIDEGLAEFFEGFRVHGETTVALAPEANDFITRKYLYADRMIPLHEYLQLTNHQWTELGLKQEHLTRYMAWSLITYLMSHDEGRHALRRYLRAIKRSLPTQAMITAYQEMDAAYPGGISALERRWHRWIVEERKAQRF